ncbi:Uncharacterized protein conserved in cyanobacteria [Gloeomargarita lithophora Alchichica-D10]|uniref:Uncharacterized protein conserved in cyanobacteria n=1 Tax=Gloeomargarita lithophora Alchichica-D10 TaxID=1188229 RepID=A0A1J0A9P3_9CYAN|nr:Uma2 family endonuclease [Gloeomargarita lithophora]APB32646.1 Uncharacterized protein conserved in cyanobacteria [Gloeomargarita lithophora Alchichica-D10]
MTPTNQALRWTMRDVEALPDNEWIRYEIIDGELYVTRAPHHRHQYAVGRIFALLDTWSQATGLGEPSIMPGLIFSDSDNVAPDVAWLSHGRLKHLLDEVGHFRGAPELVVEVLSPGKANQDRDRLAKLKLYSLQGVREYWIVDPGTQQVELYRRQEAQLVRVATLLPEDELTSPVLPGFGCRVGAFFARPSEPYNAGS